MRYIMDSWKNDRIRFSEWGENPTVMAKMKSGFAVIGDNQLLSGYSKANSFYLDFMGVNK